MTQATLLILSLMSAPVRPAPVELYYWLAECRSWPLKAHQLADNGIQVDKVRQWPGRVSARLRRPATRQRAMLAGRRLGTREAGWGIWAVRGPASIRRLMAAAVDDVGAKYCRVVATYAQARSWPAAAKTWLQRRSTCYGQAVWRGRAYTAWPCRWATERAGQGTVTQVDGLGPGVLQGGSGRRAAGVVQ